MGGTIIVRNYQRAEAYVAARRNAVGHRGQVWAYVGLERMAANLQRGGKEKRDQRALDERRLRLF